jgi:hypothetical protein
VGRVGCAACMGRVTMDGIVCRFLTGPRGKGVFSAGFRELTDTRLGKEGYAAADHMLLIRRTW